MDTSIVVPVNLHAVSLSPEAGEALPPSFDPLVEVRAAAKVSAAALSTESPDPAEVAELRERVRALAAALVSAQEAAHRHIARELHDSAGAELTGAHFSLAGIDTWLPADAPPQCVDALAAAQRSLQAVCETTRRIVADLHGPTLERGLVNALSRWTREFASRTGLRVSLTSAADRRLARLPADAALAVFRVAQEALNNVAKHAKASAADIVIDNSDDFLTLIVKDDGIGNVERRRNGQFGIGGMRARCEAFDGAFQIDLAKPGERRPRHGTTVRATFAWRTLLARLEADAALKSAQAPRRRTGTKRP
jgi:two-component system, NarL family, sensor histidine kinase UhpB